MSQQFFDTYIPTSSSLPLDIKEGVDVAFEQRIAGLLEVVLDKHFCNLVAHRDSQYSTELNVPVIGVNGKVTFPASRTGRTP